MPSDTVPVGPRRHDTRGLEDLGQNYIHCRGVFAEVDSMVNSLKDNTAPNSLLYDRDGARHGEKRLLHGPWPCATTGRETLYRVQ